MHTIDVVIRNLQLITYASAHVLLYTTLSYAVANYMYTANCLPSVIGGGKGRAMGPHDFNGPHIAMFLLFTI